MASIMKTAVLAFLADPLAPSSAVALQFNSAWGGITGGWYDQVAERSAAAKAAAEAKRTEEARGQTEEARKNNEEAFRAEAAKRAEEEAERAEEEAKRAEEEAERAEEEAERAQLQSQRLGFAAPQAKNAGPLGQRVVDAFRNAFHHVTDLVLAMKDAFSSQERNNLSFLQNLVMYRKLRQWDRRSREYHRSARTSTTTPSHPRAKRSEEEAKRSEEEAKRIRKMAEAKAQRELEWRERRQRLSEMYDGV